MSQVSDSFTYLHRTSIGSSFSSRPLGNRAGLRPQFRWVPTVAFLAPICRNLGLVGSAYDGCACIFSGGANMAARADHHRDVAAQFRSLAAIEPSDSLRQYLQRIAQRHDELAAGFEHRDPAVTRGILTWASGTRLWPSGWMRPAENN